MKQKKLPTEDREKVEASLKFGEEELNSKNILCTLQKLRY